MQVLIAFKMLWRMRMNRKIQTRLLLIVIALSIPLNANGQTTATLKRGVPALNQKVATALASLPEADTLVYINPRRILNDAAPKVVAPAELTKMRAAFEDLKKGLGVDPSALDYVVVAMRFHKPSGDLSFVPPEVIAVASGDFSADSLITLARLGLQDNAREEKHGTRSIAITKIDPVAEAAEKTPLLKSFSEIGFTALNTNTIAIGSIGYLKAAMDATDGTGRISQTAVSSLVRDPDALISAAGSPLSAFAKSFGLLGTQVTARDPRCETQFGNFYAAITMEGNNFILSGAMNADNPDTASIIHSLLSSLLQQAVSSVPDKSAQSILNGLKLTARESEIVISGAIPEAIVADLVRQQTKPATSSSSQPTKKPAVRRKRPVRRR
jgi:hypothetical protein